MIYKLSAMGAVVAASLASICCLGPLALTGLGLGGLSLAAGLTPYRSIFLGAMSVLLATAFYLTYRRREVQCTDGSCKLQSSSKTMKAALWIITAAIVVLATFPHYPAISAGRQTAVAFATGERISLSVSGLTCAACATGIEKELRKVPGVQAASVSLQTGEALVVVEMGKVATEDLLKIIESVGPYEARLNSTK